jgi:hypothetical protein
MLNNFVSVELGEVITKNDSIVLATSGIARSEDRVTSSLPFFNRVDYCLYRTHVICLREVSLITAFHAVVVSWKKGNQLGTIVHSF